jgi:FkbM family methyltransferase
MNGMSWQRLKDFSKKPWSSKSSSLRFHIRVGLAKLPYLPILARLKVSPSKQITFWWSHVVEFFDPEKSFFDYWGKDLADLQFLWRFLQPGMVFMDIGAYQGIFTIVAANKLKGGRIFAFEPSPREYRKLRTHLWLNGVSGVKAEKLALGESNGEVEFFQVVDGDETRNGLRPPQSDDRVRQISVRMTSLDEYIGKRKIDRVDIIKLDVEGGEIGVLRGAENLLRNMRPLVICEVLDATTQAWGYKTREIIRTLQKYDYEWFEIGENGSISPHIEREFYGIIKNYLAIPREKKAMLMQSFLTDALDRETKDRAKRSLQ